MERRVPQRGEDGETPRGSSAPRGPRFLRCGSTVLPSMLTFLVIVASGGLLLMIEKGMLNSMGTSLPWSSAFRAGDPQGGARVSASAEMDIQILQELRNTTIHTMCKQKNVTDIWSLTQQQKRTLLGHILVDDDYRFLYCYVPKVACSNWKRVLKMLSGTLSVADVRSKLDHRKDMVFLRSFKKDEIQYRLEHYFKFMFVRDPMVRLLSAYRNKFGEVAYFQRAYGRKIIQTYRNETSQKGDDVTLTEFVRFLLDRRDDFMNEHWMPMFNLCHPCVVNYDFIGSQENIETDSEYVLQRIGAPPQVRFPERQSWYKPVTKEILLYYLCTVPQKLLHELFFKYILDFSAFVYPLPNITSLDCQQ